MKGHLPHKAVGVGGRLAAALFLAAGLLLLGMILAPPPPTPALAMNPPAASAAVVAAPTPAVNGTLASFTALIPQISVVNLPLVLR